MEAIEREFPQSEFSDDDIAQIAILHTPFSEESEEVGDGDIIEVEPEFKWLTNVCGCTYYDQDDLQHVLKASGYHSYMERLTQIHLAVRFKKLEEIEGHYMLNSPCH